MMEEEMADCNLELQLHPSSSSSSSSPLHPNADHTHQQQHQQQLPLEKMSGEEHLLTIFYGGAICVVNVNQQQARSIMLLAGGPGAIDERTRSVSEAGNLQQCNSQALTSLPMKRSLQRFLEKRKHRIQSTNPYQDNKYDAWRHQTCIVHT